jgi:hypothetical protein
MVASIGSSIQRAENWNSFNLQSLKYCYELVRFRTSLVSTQDLDFGSDKKASSGEAAMAHYRCYLLASHGRLRAGEDIDSDTDAAAVELGRQILAHRTHYQAFEIWKRERCIHTEGTTRISVVRPPAVTRPLRLQS